MGETEKKEKKGIVRRITGVVGYIIIFAIITLLIFLIGFKASQHTVFIFGRTTVWVMTPSMEPQIPAQSYILVKRVSAEEVNVGDVIIFRSDDPSLDGSFNTHRVIEIIGDHEEFVTKGDANLIKDGYTAKADKIEGVYVRNLPALTSLGRFLFSGIGLVVSVAAVLLLIILMYVPEIVRATRRRSAELDKKRQEMIDERVRAEVERLRAEDAKKNGNAEDKPDDAEK